jgi:nicotinate-nucleotide pyrophosphorylase (carboxylating)
LILYEQIKELKEEFIERKIKEFLEEDIPEKDYTTFGTIEQTKSTKAVIEAQGESIFVGEKIIPKFFPESDVKVDIKFKDGDKIKNNDILAEITGNAVIILERERTILNLIQRLCGIAYQANLFAEKVNHKIKILDTRKTTPGLREFEKYAVCAGGGTNHRLNLSTGILIKDNHIAAAGGIKEALQKIKSMNFSLPIELEVDTFEQIEEAMHEGVNGFLLDNMTPDEAKNAVQLIRNSKDGEKIFIECSGGITYDTVAGYADTGIDAVSVGALTHSAYAAPIHMEFIDE